MIYGDEAINLLAASPIIGLIVRTLVSVPGVTRQRVWMSRRSNFAGIEPCRCQNRRKGGMYDYVQIRKWTRRQMLV